MCIAGLHPYIGMATGTGDADCLACSLNSDSQLPRLKLSVVGKSGHEIMLDGRWVVCGMYVVALKHRHLPKLLDSNHTAIKCRRTHADLDWMAIWATVAGPQ